MGDDRMHPADDRNEHLSTDLCHDILLGLTSRDVARRAGRHAATCAPCESLLQRLAGEFETLRSRAVPRRQADHRLGWSDPTHDGPSVRTAADPPPAAPRIRRLPGSRRRTWAATAAVLTAALVLLMLLWPGGRRNGADSSYWLPVEEDLVHNRADIGGDTSFEEALRAYAAHDMQRADVLLQTTLPDEGRDDMRRIYRASVLVHLDKPTQALQVLQDLDVETLPQPWRDRSLWIRLQALEAKGDTEQAAALLRQLAASPGPFGDRARKRLGEP